MNRGELAPHAAARLNAAMHSVARWSASLLALAMAFAACRSGPSPAPAERALTLVYLKTGARTQLSADEQRTVFAGHFANMERMARAGELLLAGPFGAHKTDPALRGIFVLDAGDRMRARQIAETDPGFRAGVFALDYHDLVTAAPLREFIQRELAEQDAAKAAGRQVEPGATIRGYVLLIAKDGERAGRALDGHGAVLLRGRLDGDQLFAVLDCTDLAAAATALATVGAELGEHRLEEWYASRNLESLSAPRG